MKTLWEMEKLLVTSIFLLTCMFSKAVLSSRLAVLARHSCHNVTFVYVHACICPARLVRTIYGWIQKMIWQSVLLNPFPNKPWFLRVCITGPLKTRWEKEKLLVTSNFSFSRSVFYQFDELSAICVKFNIVVCKLFQFGRV